jgi:hypothetical protein
MPEPESNFTDSVDNFVTCVDQVVKNNYGVSCIEKFNTNVASNETGPSGDLKKIEGLAKPGTKDPLL